MSDKEELAHILWLVFGGFLAHDPDKPEVFWGNAAERIMISTWLAKVKADAYDQAIAELQHEDGSPVEIVSVINPYRDGAK